MLIDKVKFGQIKLKVLDTGLKDAAWNIAMDQALLEYADKLGPFLRFLSFSPECVLVGYFQSVIQEVRVEYCRKEGIDINRRITGGGAIYFDPSQLGWEIIGTKQDFPYNLRELSKIFGSAVSFALKRIGLSAEFRERNDIEVRGKKISGMGGVTLSDNFLFQGTLLVEDKIERMLKSLKVPIEKLKPREIDSVRERVTCIEHESGRVPNRDELKDILLSGIREYLGVSLVKSDIPEEVLNRQKELLQYHRSDQWINKIDLPEEEQDILHGYFRTNDGTVKVSMTVNTRQKMLRNTLITGDFFLDPPEALFRLESLLKNIRFNEQDIMNTVDDFFSERSIQGITAYHVNRAISEVFKKWELIEEGFTPGEANNVFLVNIDNLRDFHPRVFLLPYCSKDTECVFRYQDACSICGLCTVGDAYDLSFKLDLEPVTISSFEHLMDVFHALKRRGIYEYIGSCCEPFYIKHQEEFFESGLRGVLINIEDTTCYELGKAKDAYAGRFESQTNLNLPLINKTLSIIGKREYKGVKK